VPRTIWLSLIAVIPPPVLSAPDMVVDCVPVCDGPRQ
jgi:hypothetical protein